jgi:hypothetical protein
MFLWAAPHILQKEEKEKFFIDKVKMNFSKILIFFVSKKLFQN